MNPEEPKNIINPSPAKTSNPPSPDQPLTVNAQPPTNPPPKNNRKAVIIATIIVTFIICACLLSYGLMNKKDKDIINVPSNTSNLEARDENTGLQYIKIREDNQIRTLNDVQNFKIDGIFVYERVVSKITPAITLPSSCTDFSIEDLKNYDGGIVILKNMLKGNGAVYSSLQELAKSYESKNVKTTILNINGTDVLRLEDGGNGFTYSCSFGTNKVTHNLDFRTAYVATNKDGDEIFIALAQSLNANNGIAFDVDATAKASGAFNENDLKLEMEYILKNN